ncbi:MAG: alginate O-acetyltransferase AlgX-related protein, partial [Vicinamibacteria bacterium]
ILSWCLANDNREALALRKKRQNLARGEAKKANERDPGLARRFRVWLGQHSHAYCFVADRAKHSGTLHPWLVRAGISTYDPAAAIAESTDIYRKRLDETTHAGWRISLEALGELKRRTDEKGAPLVLFVIPPNFAIEKNRWEEMKKTFGLAGEDFNLDGPTSVLREFSLQNGIYFIDPTADFLRAAQAGERLYYRNDPHWTPAGHRLAAEVLRREIARLGLLEAPPAEPAAPEAKAP